jgi:small basic protein (TIGR04137 family)
MSLHKSLKFRSNLERHRNVLTRAERVKKLLDEEKVTEEDSVFALPKVRVERVRVKAKPKKAEDAEAAEEAAVEGAEALEGAEAGAGAKEQADA